jgi:hypothetical protein
MLSLLLQLCLAAVAMAAPIPNEDAVVLTMNPAQQYGAGGGVVGFIVLILDIIVWGMHDCQDSSRGEMLTRLQSRC